MTDVAHSNLTLEQRFEWQTLLDIDYIAKLIMQYFGSNKQRDHADHTLAELFAKVPFHYSLNSDEEELSTYMAYKELVTNYERTRRITPNQHAELVTILEKRLARGSRIQSDYFESKRVDTQSSPTWESAMPPSGKSTLAVRTSLDVPLVAPRVCRSCGNPAHMLPACPVLYYTDTNNDHSIQWSESAVGQAWLANGEAMWQERLILPGYENR